MKTWMVRAGRGGVMIEAFRQAGRVAIGWTEVGSLADARTRSEVVARVKATWPDWNAYEVGNNAGQLHRFRSEIQVGDRVVSYDPNARVYHVGTVTGEYAYDPEFDEHLRNVRSVQWEGPVSRDALSVSAKNSLGSVTTVFLVPTEAAHEIEAVLKGNTPVVEPPPEEAAAEQDLFEDLEAKAAEFIKDRLARLGPRDMEQFVAGLLRAMGYKTRVSPVGPDRGRDIFASPDGLGLEDPRIFVEVKHRAGSIGAPAVRGFLGGRRPGDRCLYVSTGGFAKDALYEADRASVPLSLLDLDDLVALALEHYNRLDVEAQRLLPLKRLYWPA